MTNTTQALTADPRNTFLTTSELFDRYRWKRSTGYERIKQSGFPPPLAGGVWRLDTLHAWEEQQLAAHAQESSPVDEPPAMPPSRRRGARKDAA